jgi:tetratricopeptide (TPR) repeat protein
LVSSTLAKAPLSTPVGPPTRAPKRSPRACRFALVLIAAALVARAVPARAEDPSWATAQAVELTKQGQAHAARGETDVAARRYLDAIGFDPTYGPAYLALGALHEHAGDAQEAERAYAMGIDHVPAFAEGLMARGRLRARARHFADAAVDLEAASRVRPDDVAVLRELAAIYVGEGSLPAALAVTRRLEALADGQGDKATRSDAHVRSRALVLLVGDSDPVLAGRNARGPLRRALALRATSQ